MTNGGPSPPDCWPPCPAWCTCVQGRCVASPTTINAVRLRTPDGRFLQAAGGGGRLLVAATVPGPGPFETFRFKSPTAWPLTSGDSVSLEVCDSAWGFSGFLMRVDHNVKVFPPRKGSPGLVSYEIGGAGASVFVRGPWSAGYPAYSANDTAEWTFDILKPGGGPIQDGDSVSLRINSNWGSTFFFRVTGAGDQATVDGDAQTPGSPGTLFVVAFSEVRAGAGWRPAAVACQSCAAVTGNVSKQGTGAPIAGALVEALDVLESHPFSAITAANGRFGLADPEGRTCIPSGPVRVRATHDRHRTVMVGPLVLPGNGSVDLVIELACTDVSGVLVDVYDRPLPGISVALLDVNHDPILDINGQPFVATTDAEGRFVFKCVPHGTAVVWTPVDPMSFYVILVPPEGTSVKIVADLACGNLVGRVTDALTLLPVAGARVSIIGTSASGATVPNGQYFIPCVSPAGSKWVLVIAAGYLPGSGFGTVPMTGNSAPLDIALQPLAISGIRVRLDWGALPADLDVHLSGPDGMGGRFHCFWNSGAPVPTVSLDRDDTDAVGPETITIRPTIVVGTFVAGDYHCWVHDYSRATFDMSAAVVTILAVGQAGMSQIGRFEVVSATGDQDLDLWYVANLTLASNGTATAQPVQTFQVGDENTVL